MVITKSVEGSNCLGCVFFPIVVHKGKALNTKVREVFYVVMFICQMTRRGVDFFLLKSRNLALAGHLVLGKENPGNVSKRLEQFLVRIISKIFGRISQNSYLQVGLLGIFREIGHPDGSSVFPPEKIAFKKRLVEYTFAWAPTFYRASYRLLTLLLGHQTFLLLLFC